MGQSASQAQVFYFLFHLITPFMKIPANLIPVINNTKWNELRLTMYDFKPKLAWRTKCLVNGIISHWGREWYYNVSGGG